MRLHLVHADLVLPDTIIRDGSILIEDGLITAINPLSPQATSVDLGGRLLLPGLIDLHCDALEKEAEPRPRCLLPVDLAVMQSDRRNAACGITTPFHAISFSGSEWGVRDDTFASTLARAVAQRRGLIDNRLHLRYEVTEPSSESHIRTLIDEGIVSLLSFMDHTPGRGQFRTFESYQAYFQGAYNASTETIVALVEDKRRMQSSAPERIQALASLASRHDVQLATHDDDSPEFVAACQPLGIKISEFPINLATAQAAVDGGVATIFGAPNVLRGGSQSGNMRALDAILQGVCTCLCSDYHPPSLLAAAFALPAISELSLSGAVRLVSLQAAIAAGLTDRGALQIGMRADLIAVSTVHRHPEVELTISHGRPVLATGELAQQLHLRQDEPACV